MKDLKSYKGKDFFDKTSIKNQVLIISNQLITKTWQVPENISLRWLFSFLPNRQKIQGNTSIVSRRIHCWNCLLLLRTSNNLLDVFLLANYRNRNPWRCRCCFDNTTFRHCICILTFVLKVRGKRLLGLSKRRIPCLANFRYTDWRRFCHRP